MTPERKKLIETMARQIDPPSWDDRKHMQTFCETRLRRRKARQKAEAALRAAEDKLNVTVVPNEATEDMCNAAWDNFKIDALASIRPNVSVHDYRTLVRAAFAAIAASPYRREE